MHHPNHPIYLEEEEVGVVSMVGLKLPTFTSLWNSSRVFFCTRVLLGRTNP